MDTSRKTARVWLRENGYSEIAEMIDEVEAELKASGKKTRRNWWEILAGGKNGTPCIRYGRKFPVLQAAQIRQGKPITENALKATENETDAPPIFDTGRWKKYIALDNYREENAN